MIAGAGFAMMAWRLAGLRTGFTPGYGHPASRDEALRDGALYCSREFYRILDNASFWFDHWKHRTPGKGSFPIFL